jgi:hypothetical protein
MTFSISRLSSLDPYQPSTVSRADMGVSGWYPGWYGKGNVLISMEIQPRLPYNRKFLYPESLINTIILLIEDKSSYIKRIFHILKQYQDTIYNVSSNSTHGEEYSIQICVIVFCSGTLVSSTAPSQYSGYVWINSKWVD